MLYPALAEAARRADAPAVGLIDVGCSAGLNLTVDRVGITYSDGRSPGDPSSPVQSSASLMGERPVPARAMPEVVTRMGLDVDPFDVTDAHDARRLRTCPVPDRREPIARLDAEPALAATAPPLLPRGDPVEVPARLPEPLVSRTVAVTEPAFVTARGRVDPGLDGPFVLPHPGAGPGGRGPVVPGPRPGAGGGLRAGRARGAADPGGPGLRHGCRTPARAGAQCRP